MRPEALAALSGVDQILHGGDIGPAALLAELSAIAPVTAVRGNVDTAADFSELPLSVTLSLGGRTIHMVHDRADLDVDLVAEGVDLFVFGHSHQPVLEERGGVLHLNPGSAGRRRFRLPVTLALVQLKPTLSAEIVPLLEDR